MRSRTRFAMAGGKDGKPGDERQVAMIRVPGGCLLWVFISVALSVGLTVLVNLVLLLF